MQNQGPFGSDQETVDTSAERLAKRDRAEKLEQRQGSLLDKLTRFDAALDGHWKKWVVEAKEDYAVNAGDQWTKDALDIYEEQERNPATFNRVGPMIDAVSGAEIQNRRQVRYAPREAGDVQVNEMLTGAVEWSRDQTDANDEESQSFRDAIICGLGVTETRMNYDEDPEGMVIIERVDPLEVKVDPAARKSNYVDAKYMRRDRLYYMDEASAMFPELAEHAASPWVLGDTRGTKDNHPGSDYSGHQDDHLGAQIPAGMVKISEYQWREMEPITLVVDPQTGQKLLLSKEQTDELEQAGIDVEGDLNGVRLKKTTYWRAFRAGEACFREKLPDEEFTYKFITGKLDHIKRWPYGLVRAMKDPQRWANKFFSQIDRIISVNAKGGIIAESDAFEDPRKAEEDWARADSIIYATPGAVAAGKITNKPVAAYPQGLDRLLMLATSAIPEVTGVNAEMLGMANREQAGILEQQRKEAAYGVLSIFFDSMSRYRKLQGRLHLKLIQKYMSDGRLIRIVNPSTGQQQYLPLIHQADTGKFDVIVDESPTSPNQREKVWGMLLGLGGVMKSLEGLPPQVLLEILTFSPLPSSLIEKLRTMMGIDDPNAQAQQQQAAEAQQQMQMAMAQAQLQKTQAEAQLVQAKAQVEAVNAQTVMQTATLGLQGEQLKAQLDMERITLDRERLAHEREQAQVDAFLKRMDINMKARDLDLKEQDISQRGDVEALKIMDAREAREEMRVHDMVKGEVDHRRTLQTGDRQRAFQVEDRDVSHERDEVKRRDEIALRRREMRLASKASKGDGKDEPDIETEIEDGNDDDASNGGAYQALMLAIKGMESAATTMAEAVSKPRRRTIERGPDGRAVGVIEE